MFEESNTAKSRLWLELSTVLFLFLATAAVIVWQNSRVGVLWDLSYILENSYRISLGDAPYRDFPFPYAPLTFLVQALIIKITGAVFWHHVVYCAIIGGLGTVLTWRILLNFLRDLFPAARLLAFILTLPVIILGIYCIFPHPFYDCDCTFVILICLLLWQIVERKNFPSVLAFLTGVLFVVPLFIKQNTGLAFVGSVFLSLSVLTAINLWRRQSACGYLFLIGGVLTGLAVALLTIQFTAGLTNYQHWTIEFAAERRTPPLKEMLGIYADWTLLLWLSCFAAGFFLLRFNKSRKLLFTTISIILMSLPFAWSVVYLFLDADASERAERLVAAFPFVLIVSFVFAVLNVKRREGIRLTLPFVLIFTIHGAFLSQQLWGSTYAIWSLLIILIGITINSVVEFAKIENEQPMIVLSSLISISLLISGGFYLASNERLDYINLSDGDLIRSQLPPLKGLSIRGSYLPDFEELVDYTNKEIPQDEGILMLPGEDLFYYTTGRHPRFPVLMFDHTVNPYNSQEILTEARARDIRWLILKNDLQLDEEPMENKKELLELLRQDFKHIESLNNYEIYRRKTAADANDENDDDSDDNDNSSDDSNDDNS